MKKYIIVSFWSGRLNEFGDVYSILAIPYEGENLKSTTYFPDYDKAEIFIIPQDPMFFMSARHKMFETSNPNQFMMKPDDVVVYPFFMDEYINEWKEESGFDRKVMNHIHTLLK